MLIFPIRIINLIICLHWPGHSDRHFPQRIFCFFQATGRAGVFFFFFWKKIPINVRFTSCLTEKARVQLAKWRGVLQAYNSCMECKISHWVAPCMKLQTGNNHANTTLTIELNWWSEWQYIRFHSRPFEQSRLRMGPRGVVSHASRRLTHHTLTLILNIVASVTEMERTLVKNVSNAPKTSPVLPVSVTSWGSKSPYFRFAQRLILRYNRDPWPLKYRQ